MVNAELGLLLDLSPVFDKVKAAVANFNLNTPKGKYQIDGEDIFALVSRYTTLPEAELYMESHRLHSEIHYLLQGSEELGYCPSSGLVCHMPYDVQKDIEFWQKPAFYHKAIIDAQLAVFFDCNEGHAPRIAINAVPCNVMKVVIKFKKHILRAL